LNFVQILCLDGLGNQCFWNLGIVLHLPIQRSEQPSKGANVSEAKTESGLSENGVAALAYITFVPALFFLILPRYNRSSYVRFHCWQSILLDVAAFLVSVVLTLFAVPALHGGAYFLLGLTRVMWGVWFGLWISTSVLALNGKRFHIPVLGKLAESQVK
jgi:uncharacterized membrane protein